jgi:hypothetical protein
MNALSETQKAYLAGLIDGEGCLTILKNKSQQNENVSPVYTACLIIVMTDSEVIQYIKDLLGVGSIFIQHRENQGLKHSDTYRYTLNTHGKLYELLSSISPYMIVKRDEAAILLEYLALPKAKQAGRNHSTSPYYVMQRETYYQRLRDIKTRGKGIRANTPKAVRPQIKNPQLSFLE